MEEELYQVSSHESYLAFDIIKCHVFVPAKLCGLAAEAFAGKASVPSSLISKARILVWLK